ncbi:MAG: flagellar M-ring protein FliF [Glaciecola sp.]|jgi:flagellar M-ring protein FliF|uniref:flagellar basal-body MS-ring/collar protein FliF n=1 Tax=Congregibacter sp. TaxID=2744308 RepID=UPI0039E58E9D
MAEATDNTLFARFNGFSRQPATRQLALLIGLAASIAMAMGLVQWAVEPNYKPLYGTMAPADTNDVIASLEANGVDYRMDRRSGMVAVPAGEIHRARLLLAGDGYPRGEGVGFESLYREQEIGLSSFMEQARFHRALESELARTIGAMDSVRGARVHLAMAKQSAFLRQRERPAASVMLNLYAGRTLNERQLSGIIHLVASSVPNLDSEQVSVVDQQGKLLSGQGTDEEFGFTQDQFRYTRQLEANLNQRIVDILEPILGADAVRAQVAADLDFTRVERTLETYAPDTRVRSEQTSEEISNRPFSGGVPGTLSNEPPIDTTVALQQAAPTAGVGVEAAEQAAGVPPARTSRRSTINYEMDKTISHVRETPGTLQKLSIAVVLDYIESTADDGTTSRAAMPQERIDEITSLVREAVGFDANRGDTVSVISASFIEVPAIEDTVIESSLLEQDWIWQLAKGLLVLIVLLTLVFVVVRPLVKFAAVPMPLMQSHQGLAGLGQQAMAGGMTDDQVTLGGQGQMGLPGAAGGGAGGYQQQLQMARSVAAGEPDRAAQVVRGWVSDDG